MTTNSSPSWSGWPRSTAEPAAPQSESPSPPLGTSSETPSSNGGPSSPASLLSYSSPSPEKPSETSTPQRREDVAESLLSFVMGGNLVKSLHRYQWTEDEEVSILVDLAKADPKGSTRLAAIKELDRRRMRALEVEGILSNQREQATLRLPGQDAEVRRSSAALRIAEKTLRQLSLPEPLSSTPTHNPPLPLPAEPLPDLGDDDEDLFP